MVVKFFVAAFFSAVAVSVPGKGVDVFGLFGGSPTPKPERDSRRVSVLEKAFVKQPVEPAGASVTNAPRTAAAEPEVSVVKSPAPAVVAPDVEAENPVAKTVAAPRPALKKAATAGRRSGRPARLTSAKTYYDRKEGVAFFNGNVHVDDEQYQLHADRAYVFMDGSNDVRRIVAIGNVAMTNEARRAYAAKASYYKEGGMVVLYSGDGIVAEVRDESKEQDQVVRGKKIKFWIDTEQIEILEADISAPTGGMGKDGARGGFRKMLGK